MPLPFSYLHLVSFACIFVMYYNLYIYLCSDFQSEHDGSDVQIELNVEHHHDEDIVANMTRSPKVKYITYYEDSESLPGKRTAVWELDKGTYLPSDLELSWTN